MPSDQAILVKLCCPSYSCTVENCKLHVCLLNVVPAGNDVLCTSWHPLSPDQSRLDLALQLGMKEVECNTLARLAEVHLRGNAGVAFYLFLGISAHVLVFFCARSCHLRIWCFV